MPTIDRFGRRVYGPYLSKEENRRLVILCWDGGRKTMSYARWMMEEHLGRHLGPGEEVDHKDDDKLNDKIGNLQILSQPANLLKSARSPEMIQITCQHCGKKKWKLMRQIRHNQTRQNCRGPFCDKVCARASQAIGYPALG